MGGVARCGAMVFCTCSSVTHVCNACARLASSFICRSVRTSTHSFLQNKVDAPMHSPCTRSRALARAHTHIHTGEEAAHSVWAMMHQSVDNLEMAHDRKGKWRETRVWVCVEAGAVARQSARVRKREIAGGKFYYSKKKQNWNPCVAA